MKAMVLDSYFCLCAGKVCDKLRNVVGLIVEHHSKNVEARAGVGMLKRLDSSTNILNSSMFTRSTKRRWRESLPATYARTFPRIPMILLLGKIGLHRTKFPARSSRGYF